jgi:hypothetical protein
MVEANIYSKEKIGLDGHTFKHGDSPKLNFGYLVGVSSFW